jgi:hypothetical protein
MTMGGISTRITERFGCRHPFAGAGMAFAGGTATEAPFNINLITFFDNDAQIRVCAEEKVPVISFHWGHPSSEHLKLLLDAGVAVWEQVGNMEAAKEAVGDGVEVIVAQGWEADGHNYGGLPTMVLVPEILDAVSPALVLAAGGIVDGRGVAAAGVAAALALGADGVWVGTRLVATRKRWSTPNTSGVSWRARANRPCVRRSLAPNGHISVQCGSCGTAWSMNGPIVSQRSRWSATISR